MSATETIAWLEAAITHERALAASWSLAGWPGDANYYRRQTRLLKRVREATP